MKKIKQLASSVCLAGLLGLASAGCTTQVGGIVPKSAFTYPNSNVTPLGPVKATYTRTAFFIPPHFDFDNVKDTYNKALAQVPDANVVINYKEDTYITSVMMFNTITYTIDGTAAKMDVGDKTLK